MLSTRESDKCLVVFQSRSDITVKNYGVHESMKPQRTQSGTSRGADRGMEERHAGMIEKNFETEMTLGLHMIDLGNAECCFVMTRLRFRHECAHRLVSPGGKSGISYRSPTKRRTAALETCYVKDHW
jgi:hypothetical protein